MKSFYSLVLGLAPLFAAVCVGVVGMATPAQAYLDPGTGTMVLQLIMGGVAGAMVIGKLYWQRIKSVFGFSSPDATDATDATHSTGARPSASKSVDPDAD